MSEPLPNRWIGQVLAHESLPEPVVTQIREKYGAPFRTVPSSPPKAARIVCVATTGKASFTRADMDALPGLRRIACLGAGTEGIDAAAASALGITVTNTSAVLAHDVADLALGMVIVLFRDLREADAFVRSGAWTGGRLPLGRSLRGAKLGVLGLGAIGAAIAARAAAFGMEVAYHGRSRQVGVAYPYFGSILALARWSDVLVVSCPGGAETRNLVGAEVLELLGPEAFVVNVARGSVVDEVALVEALRAGRLAGAGLDVFADEPRPHPYFVESRRVVLTPHIGSATRETRAAMVNAFIESIGQVVAS